MKDPHVAEVRRYRMEHTEKFDSDLHLICEDLRAFEASLGKRIVTLQARRIRPTSTSSGPRKLGR